MLIMFCYVLNVFFDIKQLDGKYDWVSMICFFLNVQEYRNNIFVVEICLLIYCIYNLEMEN